jgi:DNA-binding transcriptional MerR regulator
MKALKHLQVGDVARRTGTTVRTIHYYEERGLLRPCHRSEAGYRLFGPDTPGRVEVITQLKDLGFSLEEIAQIVRAWQEAPQNEGASARLRGLLQRAKAEASRKLESLEHLKGQIAGALERLEKGQVQPPPPLFIRAARPEAP